MNARLGHFCLFSILAGLLFGDSPASAAKPRLTLIFEASLCQFIQGDHIPSKQVRSDYLEAYCRVNSTDADWVEHTVAKQPAQFISLREEKAVFRLRDKVCGGPIVEPTIKSGRDEIGFLISADNHTDQQPEAHSAQPWMRLSDFTGGFYWVS